jgi:hypothetical protein
MIICDICNGKCDTLAKEMNLPTHYEDGHMTFDTFHVCYACQIGLKEKANFAHLKFIKEKRKEA